MTDLTDVIGRTDEPFPSDAVVAAIMRHMNEDHAEDSVLICRALGGQPGTTAATMTGMDADAIRFDATVAGDDAVAVTVPWQERLTERAQVRAEVVRMYHESCAALGLEPRVAGEH